MQDCQISIWENTKRNHPFKPPVKVHQSGKAASPERQPSFGLWSLPGSPPSQIISAYPDNSVQPPIPEPTGGLVQESIAKTASHFSKSLWSCPKSCSRVPHHFQTPLPSSRIISAHLELNAPPPLFPLPRGSGNRFAALSRPTYPAPRTAAPFSATPSPGAPCRLALRTAPKSMAPPPPPPSSPAARLPNCPRRPCQSAPNYIESTQNPANPLRRNDLRIQPQ